MQSINTNYIERIKQTSANNVSRVNTSNQSRPQIDKLPTVTPDFNVNVPISYQKIRDINLPQDLKATCYKLANGQNVIIVPKKGTTVVKTYVKTGSMNEPDNLRGISHYIEHNLFNGSDGLQAGEFFDKVNDMGANTNAATGYAETNYFISSNLLNENDLEEKIKLHSSMLQTPHFAIDKLEKEKGIVNSEINMILSNPANIGYQRTIKNLYGIQSTSDDLIGGTTQNITNLTRDNVVNYFNQNYYPANMTTVITGEVNPEETMKLVAKYFNSNKKAPQSRTFEEMKPLQSAKREDIISDMAYATGIYVGFNGPENSDAKGQVLTQAIAKILTGSKNARISKEVRPYGADVFMSTEIVSTKPKDGFAVVFDCETTEENSAQVLKIIANKIDELQYKQPTDDEMNWIKKTLKKEFAERFEHSTSINSLIGGVALDGILDSVNQYDIIVDSLTPQDISEAAKKYLNTQKASVILVHPGNVSEETIKQNHARANVTFTGTSKPSKKKTAINMENVKAYKMANNIQVLTNDTKSNNCTMFLKLGSNLPKDINPATPIILYKILNAGSQFRNESEFLNDLEKDAINIQFSCEENSLEASAKFSSEDLRKTLKALKEVINNPRFTEETFKIAKSNIEEHIKTAHKTPIEKLYKEFFPNDNFGATNADVMEGLKTVTLNDVKALHQYLLQNPDGVVTISAPFSKKPELQTTLFNELSQFNNIKEFTPMKYDNFVPVEKTKVLTTNHNDYQADVIEAFKFKNNGNIKDDVTVMLLNVILGGTASSRLFNDLRETQKLAYSVRSKVKHHNNTGMMQLRIGTTTENKDTGEVSFDNIQKAIDGFNKHIKQISTEKVTDKELENAKLYLKNAFLSGNEDTTGQTISLAAGFEDYYGANKENLLIETIDTITADDILNAAKNIFNSKPVYSINATQNTLDANKAYFEKLEQA